MKADEAAAAALELAALSLAALFTFRYVSRMADPRRSERSSALAKGRAALASRLLEGRARALVLEEHELEVAGDVVCPDEICVSFDDVGGLDNLARQLQHAILCAPHTAHPVRGNNSSPPVPPLVLAGCP